MKEISDGRLYKTNDMVKADCHDCKGCEKCCHGMGQSILLDPYDMYQLEKGLRTPASALVSYELELGVEGGLILPHIRMQQDTDGCAFLADGRCRIHDFRPGICRLFPLGRYYEDGGFRYFLQTGECTSTNRTKIRVEKWLGIPNLRKYEKYVMDWHAYIMDLQGQIREHASGGAEASDGAETSGGTDGDVWVRRANIAFLNKFFLVDYDAERDFYEQFYERLQGERRELMRK